MRTAAAYAVAVVLCATVTPAPELLAGIVMRMFLDDGAKLEFELTDLARYDGGVLLQVYRPVD